MTSEFTSEVYITTENPTSVGNAELSPGFLYIYLILAIITIGGNGMVIISYVIDKSIRLSTPNTYILNLAIADFLVGVFEFLVTFIWSISGANINPPLIPCFLWGWIRHAATLSSAVVVFFLSWDRYKLVSNALTYRRDQTPSKAARRTLIAWVVVFGYVFALHTIGVLLFDGAAGCIPSEAPSQVILFSFFPEFALPLSIIVVLNVIVLLALRRRTFSKIRENFTHENAARTDSSFKGNSEQTSINIPGADKRNLSAKTLDKQERAGRNILDKTYRAGRDGHEIDDKNSEINNFEVTTQNIELEDNPGKQFSERETEQNGHGCNLNATISENCSSENRNVRKESGDKKSCEKSQETKKEMLKLYKAVKALVIFTSIYISCWIPFYVISLLSLIKSDISDYILFLGTLILALNSTINPFLYAAMSMKFRRRFLLLLKCHFLRN
ncbi:Muscarinic acetylcholine receptor M2 [Holothuria leucospilota]|uniref:Muscarinic acetylcholine receptor M2 n=1 Tax=Holothuria leucospilota TaxID=206669 RepID=A0A9Q1HBW8_HOLLE|nr:Muscarinic acetylcholine receptor M2 [Holothuria leucospilota]